jgi:hypothetical protein
VTVPANRSRRILSVLVGVEPLRIVGDARLTAVLEAWAIVENPPRLVRWPLGELADVVSEPQPEQDAARSPSGPGLLDDGEARTGPLDSDYGHGWAS